MKLRKAEDKGWLWLGVFVVAVLVVIVFSPFFPARGLSAPETDPWDHVPRRLPDTDYSILIEKPIQSGPDADRLGDESLRYTFPTALGDRYPEARPKAGCFSEREYVAKVKALTAAKSISGDCGG